MATPDPGGEAAALFSADDASLRGCLRDLVALLALPAMWTGADRADAVLDALLDALVSLLRLDVAYARAGPAGTEPVAEVARSVSDPAQARAPASLARALLPLLEGRGAATAEIDLPSGGARVRALRVPLGIDAEEGLAVLASRRPDFPTESEALVVSVAANLAVTGLRAVRELVRRKRAEDLARESVARFGAVFEQMIVGIAVKDVAGRFVLVNQRYCDIVGRPSSEVLASRMQDLTHPDDLAENLRLFEQAARGGSGFVIEKRYVRPDGSLVWVQDQVSAVREAGGATRYVVAVVQDVTERRRAFEERERLLAASERHVAVLRALAEAALVINSPGSVAEVLERITEKAREIIGAHQAVTSMTVDASWAQSISARSLSAKYARYAEYAAAPDGSGIYSLVCRFNRPMRLTQAELERHPAWRGFGAAKDDHPPIRGWLAAPLVSRAGKNMGLVQLSDRYEGEFTEQDEAVLVQLARFAAVAVENAELQAESERARVAAEVANRAKDEFLAVLSHELRTPLTSVLGWARMLRAGKLDPRGAARALEVIERNASAQAQLINDILDVSRIIAGKLRLERRVIDRLGSLVERAVEALRPTAEAKQIRLALSIGGDAGPVDGDAARLEQVVWNLVSNAVKFTPEHGTIEVACRRTGASVEIRVRDTGKGIASEFLPRLFQRFSQADMAATRAHGGLGLGLAIVRHLVELHGGSVRAESDGEDRGALLTVTLPCAGELSEATGRSADAAGRLPSLAGVHILVVEDEADIRDLLRTILVERGATVEVASSAGAAVEAVARGHLDVLLCDIGLAGEDGYALVRRIRALPPARGGSIHAAAITAYAGLADRERALEAGFDMHIAKPIDPPGLVVAVAGLAGRLARP